RGAQAEEARDRGTGDVCVEDADALVRAAQTDGEQRGDERLAHAALAGHDRYDRPEGRAPRERPGRPPRGGAIGVGDPRDAALAARLVERAEDRFDPQAVRVRALLYRLVLVHAAARAVQA